MSADTDLDRIEARLIQLENELAASARKLALLVTPPDAVVRVNGAELRNGESFPYARDAALAIDAGGDTLKPVTATLVPGEQHTQLAVTLCPANVEEEYLYQPPDQVVATPAGSAELRLAGNCPEAVEEGRRLADQACAARYPGAARDPGKYFTLRRQFSQPPTCLVIAECVVKTTVTPDKIRRTREVDNTQCTSTAVLQ